MVKVQLKKLKNALQKKEGKKSLKKTRAFGDHKKKNALLNKEGKSQQQKKEGTPSNFRIKFLTPSFYIYPPSSPVRQHLIF